MILLYANRIAKLVLIASTTMYAPATSADAFDNSITVGDYAAALESVELELSQRPLDETLRFRRARVLAYMGDYAGALRDYDKLRSRRPDNADYAFGRAQVLSWEGRDIEALAELRAATWMAPTYEDVWKLRYTILSRQPEEAAAKELDNLRRAAAGRFPKADWWHIKQGTNNRQWIITTGAGYDDLSNARLDWQHQFVEARWARAAAGRYLVRVDWQRRFDRFDRLFAFEGGWQLGADWSLGLDVAVTPRADFLPNNVYGGHIGRTLRDGWAIDIAYRRREYASAQVDTMTATVENYFGNFRAAYALMASRLDTGSSSFSHTLHMDWYHSDQHRFRVTINAGDEAETIAVKQILETNIRGISFYANHQLTERLGLGWWVGTHDQGNLYRRQYIGMAVSIGI